MDRILTKGAIKGYTTEKYREKLVELMRQEYIELGVTIEFGKYPTLRNLFLTGLV
jgi:hypothetical protein